MLLYKNLSGDSGIKAFEIGDDYIIVEFTNGEHYMYTNEITSKTEVDRMKELAIAGQGLNSMLAKRPYHKHAKKW